MESLDVLIKSLEEEVANIHLDSKEKMDTIIKKIAHYYIKYFNTQEDEVAIFLVDKSVTFLSFIYPPYLVGSEKISIDSDKPIVTHIYRSGKSLIDNEFLERERLFQYEFIKTDTNESKLIWKLIGAVISDEGEKIGVIQISRKRAPYSDVGENFTEEDLKHLESSILRLAPYIKKYMPYA